MCHQTSEEVERTIPLQLLEVPCERITGLLPALLLQYLWALHYYKYCMNSLTGILQCALKDGVG